MSELKINLKQSAPGFIILYALALINALIVRIVLAIMSSQGALKSIFDSPRGSNSVEMLAHMITGVPLITLVGTSALIGAFFAGCHAWAGRFFYANQFGPVGLRTSTPSKFLVTLAWLLGAVLITALCILIVASGIFSRYLLTLVSYQFAGTYMSPALPWLIGVCLISLQMVSISVIFAALSRAQCNSKLARHTKENVFWRTFIQEILIWILAVGLAIGIVGGLILGSLYAYPAQAQKVQMLLVVAIIINMVLSTAGHFLAQGALKKINAL